RAGAARPPSRRRSPVGGVDVGLGGRTVLGVVRLRPLVLRTHRAPDQIVGVVGVGRSVCASFLSVRQSDELAQARDGTSVLLRQVGLDAPQVLQLFGIPVAVGLHLGGRRQRRDRKSVV